jgi:cytoskeletal protein CcmA (bactofilin family)
LTLTTDEYSSSVFDGSFAIARVIPAQAIRKALLEEKTPDPRGLNINGAIITGDLDLSFVIFRVPLALIACSLNSIRLDGSRLVDLNLTGSEISPTISSSIPCATMDGLRATGSLNLSDVHMLGTLSMVGGRVEGNLHLSRATIVAPERGAAVILDSSTIEGSVFAEDAHLQGRFEADGVIVGRTFSCTGASIANADGPSWILSGATIGRDITASEMSMSSGVSATGISVGGSVDLGNCRMDNSVSDIEFDGATVGGNLLLLDSVINGEVRGVACDIWGQLSCDGASLGGLCFDGGRVRGGLFARGAEIRGEFSFVDASIDLEADLTGANLLNPGGNALSSDRASIKGDLFVDEVRSVGDLMGEGLCVSGRLSILGGVHEAVALRGSKLGWLLVTGEVRMLDVRVSRIGCLSARPTGALRATGWALGDVQDCEDEDGGLIRSDPKAFCRWLETDSILDPQPWIEAAAMYGRAGRVCNAVYVRQRLMVVRALRRFRSSSQSLV